jgi:hypothetical protein
LSWASETGVVKLKLGNKRKGKRRGKEEGKENNKKKTAVEEGNED